MAWADDLAVVRVLSYFPPAGRGRPCVISLMAQGKKPFMMGFGWCRRLWGGPGDVHRLRSFIAQLCRPCLRRGGMAQRRLGRVGAGIPGSRYPGGELPDRPGAPLHG